MKLMTTFELATKLERELRILYRELFNAAMHGDRHGLEPPNAIASLVNIRRVMTARGLRL